MTDFVFHKEKVINGVLHHWGKGEYTPYTPAALTRAFIAMKIAYEEVIERENELLDKLNNIKKVINSK